MPDSVGLLVGLPVGLPVGVLGLWRIISSSNLSYSTFRVTITVRLKEI